MPREWRASGSPSAPTRPWPWALDTDYPDAHVLARASFRHAVWAHWFNEERASTATAATSPAEFEAAFYAGHQPALPGPGKPTKRASPSDPGRHLASRWTGRRNQVGVRFGPAAGAF